MIEQELNAQESAQIHLGELMDTGHEEDVFQTVEAILDESALHGVVAEAIDGAAESAADEELLMAEQELGLVDEMRSNGKGSEGEANV
jgi:hypothetical protein